jgi:general secretion pathway protein K
MAGTGRWGMGGKDEAVHPEAGFVLIAMLWAVLIASLIALALIRIGDNARHDVRNASARARAVALADAGIERALAEFLVAGPRSTWPLDGTPRRTRLLGSEVEITIEDELGKVDLNAGSHESLSRLFAAAGASLESAEALASAVEDWRDGDALHRLNGAEAEAYAEAGLVTRPRDGPFESVEELSLVFGMPPTLFDRVRGAVTVYARTPIVDPATALPLARTALGYGTAPLPAPVIGQLPALTGRAFTVRVHAGIGTAEATREAVIGFTGDPTRPWWVYRWEDAAGI